MSDVVIRAEGLGKAYQIRHEAERRHDRFSEMLAERARRLFRRDGEADPTRETFWALRDVSFEVREGEVVGIIGRNGAGKSTLLKVLSRITEPTEGRVELRGRVASLLEVGTGFHPELTGRENVFLNGAILGMSRAEIRRKFDEIVDFAGVEKFLDTPVKRYSSGMRVRLAFAVAAHLEPEILVVDEVLAVGDAEFQRKCLGKMGEVAKGGRTVLFVSHNMAAIKSLCERSMLLLGGRLATLSQTEKAIDDYFHHIDCKTELNGGSSQNICDVYLTEGANTNASINYGAKIALNIDLKELQHVSGCMIGIKDRLNQKVIHLDSRNSGNFAREIHASSRVIRCEIDNLYLAPGRYYVNIALTSQSGIEHWVENALSFDVKPDAFNQFSPKTTSLSGPFAPPHVWSAVES